MNLDQIYDFIRSPIWIVIAASVGAGWTYFVQARIATQHLRGAREQRDFDAQETARARAEEWNRAKWHEDRTAIGEFARAAAAVVSRAVLVEGAVDDREDDSHFDQATRDFAVVVENVHFHGALLPSALHETAGVVLAKLGGVVEEITSTRKPGEKARSYSASIGDFIVAGREWLEHGVVRPTTNSAGEQDSRLIQGDELPRAPT